MSEFDPIRSAFKLVAFVIIAEVCLSGYVIITCTLGMLSTMVPTGSCGNIREDTFALMSGLLAAAIALMVGRQPNSGSIQDKQKETKMAKYTVVKSFTGKNGKAWSAGQAYTETDEAEAKKQVDAGNLKPEATPHDPNA